MDLELLTIGTELLLGFTIDTNGAEIARALASIGVRVARRTTVGDTPEAIREGVRDALSRTGAVLTTGGLGPTRDDVSKAVVAELYGMALEFEPAIWEELVARFARLGRAPAPSNRSQAEVPRGAVVLPNRWGTAPGLWFEGPPGLVIMLPGVPGEMRKLVEHEVVPRLAARSHGGVIRSRVVRTTGIPESTLAERLGEIEHDVAPLTLAYLPGFDGVDLRLSAWGLAPDDADARLAAGAELLRQRAGPFAYGEGEDDLAALVLDRARTHRVRLGTAESCTGGLVAARITDVPGSSDVFLGSIVSYSDSVKRERLGVPADVLAAHGAVSAETAAAMAAGAREALGVDVAVSITGVAGPGGGSDEKPVGLVYLHAIGPAGELSRRLDFPGDRETIRLRAAVAALHLVRGLVTKS